MAAPFLISFSSADNILEFVVWYPRSINSIKRSPKPIHSLIRHKVGHRTIHLDSSTDIMSKTCSPTFGGAFRTLVKDLEDMSRDTRNRYLLCASQNDKSCLDDIQKVEERIIEAVIELPAQRLFRNISNGHQLIHSFSDHWLHLRELKLEWEHWRSKWMESVERRGDLIAIRDWKKDKKVLENIHRGLIVSKPEGFEEDPEWTRDYHDKPCLTTLSQTQCTSKDSKDSKDAGDTNIQDPISSDMAPPPYTAAVSDTRQPTFGYVYRDLIQDLRDLVALTFLEGEIGTNSISPETLDKIQKKEQDVLKRINFLPSNNLFVHMTSGWTKSHWTNSHKNFTRGWECLLKVCDKWKGPGKLTIDTSDWQNDRNTLESFISCCSKAEPKGFQQHPGWTEDYCAVSCLTTTQDRETASKARWSPGYGVATGRLYTYTTFESLHTTFGGAWRRLKQDLHDMKDVNTDWNLTFYGWKDRDFWQRILDLELRIIQNVHVMPKHPLFEHMHAIGTSFMSEWKRLEGLSRGWETSRFIWSQPTSQLPTLRNWKRDRDTISWISLDHAWPGGYDTTIEWTQNTLPVDELQKPNWLESERTLGEPKDHGHQATQASTTCAIAAK